MGTISSTIDLRLTQAWSAQGVTPADRSTDAEFVRRTYLDLVGRIPTVTEARDFLQADDAAKRERLIDLLIGSPSHARHMATFWRREWLPQLDGAQFAALADDFDVWLADVLGNSPHYDQIVEQLLTASREPAATQAPVAFMAASEFKPEELAANSTRAFLGMNLSCAQCHNHPFARWTQDQFWQTAAFFARPADSGVGAERFTLTIPNSDRKVRAQLLSGAEPNWPAGDDAGRQLLSKWIIAQENPYFAKNGVNRLWAKLFGAGLADPQGDLDDPAQVDQPELLKDLAAAFADVGFDLPTLTRGIVCSQAYQLTSRGSSAEDAGAELFVRATVRGLTGEQLYDSLQVAGGWTTERADLDPKRAVAQRNRFVKKFAAEHAGAAATRSILQSLTLMNGELTAESTSHAPVVDAVVTAPFLGPSDKVELLYFATLSRKPTSDESSRMTSYLTRAQQDGKLPQAVGDLFWAILNSSEFNTNH